MDTEGQGPGRRPGGPICGRASGAPCCPIWAVALAWGWAAGEAGQRAWAPPPRELPGQAGTVLRSEPGPRGTEGWGGHPGPGLGEGAEAQHLGGLTLGVTWQDGLSISLVGTELKLTRGLISVSFKIRGKNEYRCLSPRYPKVDPSCENFWKPKCRKAKKQLPLISMGNV